MQATHPGDSAAIIKRVLPLMNRHAPDYLPPTYATWYAYANGDSAVRGALDPLIADGRRVDPARVADVYVRHVAGARERALAAASDGISTLLARIENSVDASRAGAQALLTEIATFEASLGPDERRGFGERLARLSAATQAVQHTLGRAAAQLDAGQRATRLAYAAIAAGGVDNAAQGDFARALDAVVGPSAAAPRVGTPQPGAPRPAATGDDEYEALRHALHLACTRADAGKAGSVLLLALDAPRHPDGSPAPLDAKPWLTGLACLARAFARGARAALTEQHQLLLLVDGADGGAMLALADRLRDSLARMKPPGLDPATRPTASIAVSGIGAEDLPEGVIGRLIRGVARVQMQGGGQVEQID